MIFTFPHCPSLPEIDGLRYFPPAIYTLSLQPQMDNGKVDIVYDTVLSIHSLKDSIEELLTGIRHIGEFEIKFTSVINEYTDCSLARDKKLAFLGIMMARLSNIMLHSPAKRIRVSLMQRNMDIILYIHDDGADPDGQCAHQQRSMSYIDTRVRSFGGRMDILTNPDGGCSVTVLLPYHS